MQKKPHFLRNSGLIIVAIMVTVIFTIAIFGNIFALTFNPPYLRLVLNSIFISATNFFVAVVSVRSFLQHGQISFALLSGALVASGLAAFISGGLSGIPRDATFIVFNVGFLLSAVMQAFGAVYLSATSPTSKVYSRRRIIIALILLLPILSLIVLTIFSVLGLTPEFVTQMGATTDLRQFIISLSFLFFVSASAIFAYQYFRTKARPLYWYSLALALFALDTVVAYNSAQLSDILQWAGRISDYIGGVFFIIAVLTLRKQEYVGENFSERWFETLTNNRTQLASLFTNMLSGFAYLRIIMGSNKDAVDAVFVEVNDSFEKNTGLERSKVLGKMLTQVVIGIKDDPANWITFFGNIALKKEPARRESYMQGLNRWLRVSAYSPERGYVVVLIDDITTQKQLQKQLEDHTKNLEKLVEERTNQLRTSERLAAIGQTASMVGHDIRNPLQAITGDLYLIEQETQSNPKCLSSEISESITAINENVAYINKIVSDLQDYTRTLKPSLSQVSIKETITSALAGRTIPPNITVKLPASDLVLETDPTFLRRIITNLITNAIQAMPDGGTLTLDVYTQDGHGYVSVQDTGVGISEETKANLFKPLFTTKAKGQGLGLAVIKRLIDSLNGNIIFESEKGKGTKFVVELPLKTNHKFG